MRLKEFELLEGLGQFIDIAIGIEFVAISSHGNVSRSAIWVHAIIDREHQARPDKGKGVACNGTGSTNYKGEDGHYCKHVNNHASNTAVDDLDMTTVISSSAQQAHNSLDIANADLALLQTNLAKAKKTSGKATVLLSSFDDRLARLEKTVSHIHRNTVPLTRINGNITALLEAIDLLLSHSDLIEKEEMFITKGPRMNNLEAYKESLTKLVEAQEQIRKSSGSVANQKDQDAMSQRINAAVESGARQLGQILQGWVREASPQDSSKYTRRRLCVA